MDSDDSLQTIAAKAPITAERRLNFDLDDEMPKPHLARALVAVDPECLHGSKGHHHHNMSVLQQHVAFFDRNNDGIIYPWETYKGFRAIGLNVFISLAAAVLINIPLSYRTLPGWIPSLLFPIYIENIHRAKHGSDSEVYDTEGSDAISCDLRLSLRWWMLRSRFDPSKFDAIFSKYARTHPDGLTFLELQDMIRANRNIYDPFGWFAARSEWRLLYNLAKDEKGFLPKEAIRGVYDGSLFEIMEKQRASTKMD